MTANTSNRIVKDKSAAASAIATRLASANWSHIADALNADGYARLPGLLVPAECRAVSSRYPDDNQFRSRIAMARHGFGQGEYKYFDYPLPEPVADLRHALYPRLAPIANKWMERMRLNVRFPAALPEFIKRCHAAGQTRPTPLLLKYGAGDYNCLHQDLYGATAFPLQVAVLLSAPKSSVGEGDFEGGEFILVEQRPRMQSRAAVVPLSQGDAVVFPVNERPVAGTKGDYRVKMRHGVSRIHSGERFTLGIIFHDAA